MADIRSVETLRAQFNQDIGLTRLIILVPFLVVVVALLQEAHQRQKVK